MFEGKCTVLLVKFWYLSLFLICSNIFFYVKTERKKKSFISSIRHEGEFSSVP